MSTDSNLILCNRPQQFLRQIFSLHKKLPHPPHYSSKTSNSKNFTPTTMRFLKKSLTLTLPLQFATPKLCLDDEQFPLHHLSMMNRSMVLTLPLLIGSHTLKLLTLVDACLRPRHVRHPPQTASRRGRARTQAHNWNVQNFTCPKSTLTLFQFLMRGRD